MLGSLLFAQNNSHSWSSFSFFSFFLGWGEWRKNSEQFVLQSPPPARFPNHSSHAQLFHNHIFKNLRIHIFFPTENYVCFKCTRCFAGSKCKFKVKLLLIDCCWYQWNRFLTMHCDRLSYWNCSIKHTTQFLSFVIYDKNVKMKPLKVRAKLCTQIHELLWLRAAELQRRKMTTEWEREVPNQIKEASEEAWKDLFSSESEQLFRQITRDPTAFRTRQTFIVTLHFCSEGISQLPVFPRMGAGGYLWHRTFETSWVYIHVWGAMLPYQLSQLWPQISPATDLYLQPKCFNLLLIYSQINLFWDKSYKNNFFFPFRNPKLQFHCLNAIPSMVMFWGRLFDISACREDTRCKYSRIRKV